MNTRSILLAAVLFSLISSVARFDYSSAKNDLDPQKLVAEHLKSLGDPMALARIKTRSIEGLVTLRFLTGVPGQKSGEAQFVAEKGKMGIIFSYQASGYRGVRSGEYFAYDGREVTAGSSRLGEFLSGYHTEIIKNGLLGGALNVGWPLLNIQESEAQRKCYKKMIDKRSLWELEYMPRKSMGNLIVRIYFDPATFYHVMTKYCRQSGLDELTEEFDEFRKIDGITLPYKYSLFFQGSDDMGVSYSMGTIPNHPAVYTFEVQKIVHNEKINPKYYYPSPWPF